MEAMEGFEDLGDIGKQSVRAIAKLANSDKVMEVLLCCLVG